MNARTSETSFETLSLKEGTFGSCEGKDEEVVIGSSC